MLSLLAILSLREFLMGDVNFIDEFFFTSFQVCYSLCLLSLLEKQTMSTMSIVTNVNSRFCEKKNTKANE